MSQDTNTNEHAGVWILAEQTDGRIGRISHELITRATALAEKLNTDLTAMVFGLTAMGWICRPLLIRTWPGLSDAGIAIGTYLEGLRDGKLLASVAPGSDRIMVPPRTFCELSWTPSQKLVELPGTGRINTFSLSYVNWDATRRDEPLMPAVIELDGASEGMGILQMLGGIDPEDVEIGMAVRAVWRPPGEREGSITDILYFEPIPEKPKKAATRRKAATKAKKSGEAATGRAKS